MPKINLQTFNWGIPGEDNSAQYLNQLDSMRYQFFGKQDVDDVCLALQALVTLEKTNKSHTLHPIAMRVIQANLRYLLDALKKIDTQLLKESRDEYLAILITVAHRRFKSDDSLTRTIIDYPEQSLVCRNIKALIEESAQLLNTLPNKDEKIHVASSKLKTISSQLDKITTLKEANQLYQSAKTAYEEIKKFIDDKKSLDKKIEDLKKIISFPCESNDESKKLIFTTGQYRFAISYKSIQKSQSNAEHMSCEILIHILDELIKNHQQFLDDNNISKTNLFFYLSHQLHDIFKKILHEDINDKKIRDAIHYINILSSTDLKNSFLTYEHAMAVLERKSNDFVGFLLSQRHGDHKFLRKRTSRSSKFSDEILKIFNQMQPGSQKTLRLLNMVFEIIFKKDHALDSFNFASLQAFANLAWNITEDVSWEMQISIFDRIMSAVIIRNLNPSLEAGPKGFAAVCITLQYLMLCKQEPGNPDLLKFINIINTHHAKWLDRAIQTIHDFLPSKEQKQLFIQKLKTVALHFSSAEIRSKLENFSYSSSSFYLYQSPHSESGNCSITDPHSPESEDYADNAIDEEGLVPKFLL